MTVVRTKLNKFLEKEEPFLGILSNTGYFFSMGVGKGGGYLLVLGVG